MRNTVLRAVLAASVAASALAASLAPARAADEYRLGAEDRVRLRVNEWRPGKGETYEWKAFTGEFTVDSAGRLALPFIGAVSAAGRTTDDIAAEIGERLQRKAGLLQRPDAAVEVSQFRPVYVVGLVDKPGAYPYRPQLTVLQAVGLAGGFYRPPEMGMQRLARESVTARGDLADIRVEQVAQGARRARLESEMKELPAIRFPDAVTSQRALPAAADAMREEQALFEARRAALTSQTEALNQAKLLIAAEIETLQAKIVSQDRQIGLARKELEGIVALVQKGLSISPRQLALEQTVAQMESTRLDHVLAMSRARQDLSKNDRTLLDLRSQRQSTVLSDLRETQTKLAKLDERAETLTRLINDSEVVAPRMMAEARTARRRSAVFLIVRQTAEGTREIAAAEGDALLPGDVVKIDGEAETGRNAEQPAEPRVGGRLSSLAP